MLNAADDDSLPLYGLDKELAEKQAAKYDPAREQEVRTFIESVVGEPLPSGKSFAEALKDGQTLCKLMNALLPEHTIKISPSGLAFKKMENINNFLDRCQKLGIPKFDTFMTVDLFEEKNIPQVIQCIYSVSRHAHAADPAVMLIGPKLAQKAERNFSNEQLSKAKAAVPLLASFASSAGSGSFGNVRQVYDPSIGTGDTTAVTKLLSAKAEAEKNAGARIGARREIGGKYAEGAKEEGVVVVEDAGVRSVSEQLGALKVGEETKEFVEVDEGDVLDYYGTGNGKDDDSDEVVIIDD
ncbi:calponin homology domain-containing protein [Cladochytrium replicatum]|nr:calponin homology domain-containing protein [Cladochytrium replicatum]